MKNCLLAIIFFIPLFVFGQKNLEFDQELETSESYVIKFKIEKLMPSTECPCVFGKSQRCKLFSVSFSELEYSIDNDFVTQTNFKAIKNIIVNNPIELSENIIYRGTFIHGTCDDYLILSRLIETNAKIKYNSATYSRSGYSECYRKKFLFWKKKITDPFCN